MNNPYITKIQRKGDIFFCIDNLKGAGLGHFYIVMSPSEGYRKPNMCLQLTSASYKEDDLVHIILSQGVTKTPLLSKVIPYGIYEIPDSEFEPQNYRGNIPPDSEGYKLIETLMLDRLNLTTLSISKTAINGWLKEWNEKVKNQYSILLQKKNDYSSKANSVNKQTVSSIRTTNTSPKSSTDRERERIDGIIIRDMDSFLKFNKSIFEIGSIVKGKSTQPLRDKYKEFESVICSIETEDTEMQKLLEKRSEMMNYPTLSDYARASGVKVHIVYYEEREMYKKILGKIPTLTLPIDTANNRFTVAQIEKMSRSEIILLIEYLFKFKTEYEKEIRYLQDRI